MGGVGRGRRKKETRGEKGNERDRSPFANSWIRLCLITLPCTGRWKERAACSATTGTAVSSRASPAPCRSCRSETRWPATLPRGPSARRSGSSTATSEWSRRSSDTVSCCRPAPCSCSRSKSHPPARRAHGCTVAAARWSSGYGVRLQTQTRDVALEAFALKLAKTV